jgi:hypothetical protein
MIVESGKWIGVDLDGTLAHHEGWVSESHIGAPIPLMVERVKLWLSQGQDVRIFTARISGRKVKANRRVIEAWCSEHLGVSLPITNKKDHHMAVLYDDRCVQVEKNTGRLLP